MSVIGAMPEAPPAEKVRRRRKTQPGISILAQGEPLMWLCGGALALCLVMIVCLLGFVVYQGTSTFWPQPLVRVETRDGNIYMGEYTRSDTYRLTLPMANDLPEAVREEALALMGGNVVLDTERRLMRTGNFDITGSDFQWISTFEFVPEEQTSPEWGLVVERMEWGRFYGFPEKFTVRFPRPASPMEEWLEQALAFLQNASYELSEESAQQQLTAAREQLEAELTTLQQKQSAEFLKQFSGEEGTWVAMVEGEPQPLAEVDEKAIVSEIQEIHSTPEAAWAAYQQYHDEARDRFEERRDINQFELGALSDREKAAFTGVLEQQLEQGVVLKEPATQLRELQFQLNALVEVKTQNAANRDFLAKHFASQEDLVAMAAQAERALNKALAQQMATPQQRVEELTAKVAEAGPEAVEEVNRYLRIVNENTEEAQELLDRVREIDQTNSRYLLTLRTAQDVEKPMTLDQIVRAYPANQLSFGDRVAVYLSRWKEFLWANPREANSEGGVFPAICGTVTMTLIMVFLVAPFGVLASLYLREYAKGGIVVSMVRISINNLAGVPSIVFGVFGLGFFCYILGAYIDAGPQKIGITPWPTGTWNLWLLSLLALCILSLALSYFGAVGRFDTPTPAKRVARYAGIVGWLTCGVLLLTLLATTPYFGGFYEAEVTINNNPRFGKGALIWASLTLALLTLPVVIVATEESLAAVPNSLREGSYATGASKWQTIRRIVLPHAMPGIMTGMILAMARGAGEVAPLMLVGALKVAPALPLDLADWSGFFGPAPTGPVHLDRSFMHLGFHIYDLALQSRNSEAAKPMVFTTTLLLIVLIAILNLSAVWLRARLRKHFRAGAF